MTATAGASSFVAAEAARSVSTTSAAAVPAAPPAGQVTRAARVGDPVGSHSRAGLGAFLGGLGGFLVGAVGVALAAGAIVLTAGMAAPIVAGAYIGLAAAGAGLVASTAKGVSTGAKVGATFSGSPCASVKSGSENVFIEGKPAARANLDQVTHSSSMIKSGSSTVFVNGQPAGREGEKSTCGGIIISTCAQKTWIGGASTDKGQSESGIDSLVSTADSIASFFGKVSLGLAVAAAAVPAIFAGSVVGAIAAGAKGAAMIGAGFGLSMGGGMAGHKLGTMLDSATGRTDGRYAMIGEEVGSNAAGFINPAGLGKAVGTRRISEAFVSPQEMRLGTKYLTGTEGGAQGKSLVGDVGAMRNSMFGPRGAGEAPRIAEAPTAARAPGEEPVRPANDDVAPPTSDEAWRRHVVRSPGFDGDNAAARQYGENAERALQQSVESPQPTLRDQMDFFAQNRAQTAKEMNDPDAANFGQWRSEFAITPARGRYKQVGEFIDANTTPKDFALQIKGDINGESVPLTGLSRFSPMGPAMFHTGAEHIPRVMEHSEGLYKDILASNGSRGEIMQKIGELHWWLAHAMPFNRGSAAITDLTVKNLMLRKGIEPTPYKRGVVPDLEAITARTPEEFARTYASRFEPPGAGRGAAPRAGEPEAPKCPSCSGGQKKVGDEADRVWSHPDEETPGGPRVAHNPNARLYQYKGKLVSMWHDVGGRLQPKPIEERLAIAREGQLKVVNMMGKGNLDPSLAQIKRIDGVTDVMLHGEERALFQHRRPGKVGAAEDGSVEYSDMNIRSLAAQLHRMGVRGDVRLIACNSGSEIGTKIPNEIAAKFTREWNKLEPGSKVIAPSDKIILRDNGDLVGPGAQLPDGSYEEVPLDWNQYSMQRGPTGVPQAKREHYGTTEATPEPVTTTGDQKTIGPNDSPPLQRMHSDEATNANRSSLDHWGSKSTEEIQRSLAPGAEEPLIVDESGKIWNGNTRVKILQDRGVDVNSLPREPYQRSPDPFGEDRWSPGGDSPFRSVPERTMSAEEARAQAEALFRPREQAPADDGLPTLFSDEQLDAQIARQAAEPERLAPAFTQRTSSGVDWAAQSPTRPLGDIAVGEPFRRDVDIGGEKFSVVGRRGEGDGFVLDNALLVKTDALTRPGGPSAADFVAPDGGVPRRDLLRVAKQMKQEGVTEARFRRITTDGEGNLTSARGDREHAWRSRGVATRKAQAEEHPCPSCSGGSSSGEQIASSAGARLSPEPPKLLPPPKGAAPTAKSMNARVAESRANTYESRNATRGWEIRKKSGLSAVEFAKLHPEPENKVYHDPEHSLKVAGFNGRIAEAFGAKGRDLQLVEMAGLLHDVDPARAAGKPPSVARTIDWLNTNQERLKLSSGERAEVEAMIRRTEFPFNMDEVFPNKDGVKVAPPSWAPYGGKTPEQVYEESLLNVAPERRAFVMENAQRLSKYADQGSYYVEGMPTVKNAVSGLEREIGLPQGSLYAGTPNFANGIRNLPPVDGQIAQRLGVDAQFTTFDQMKAKFPEEFGNFDANMSTIRAETAPKPAAPPGP